MNDLNTDPTTAPAVSARAEVTPFYTKKWFVGVVALLVGIGLGAASAAGGAVEDAPEYKALSKELSEVRADAASLESQLEPMQEAVDAIDERVSALDVRESEVSDLAKEVASDAKAVEKREKAVGVIEDEIEANTISGDGTYEVGEDMKAGKYKSKSDSECYWSVNGDSNGDNIIANGLSSGPQTVTVADGQYFETARCGDWVRQ